MPFRGTLTVPLGPFPPKRSRNHRVPKLPVAPDLERLTRNGPKFFHQRN
ncbi:MAG: hypothetical protein RIS09_1014 [Actinomycetota bacterium]|jgi:hypothetical protein